MLPSDAEPSGLQKYCPDITQCRATLLGTGNLVFCQNENRLACGYVLPFGAKYFCLHPQCLDIAGRTGRT